MNGGAVAYLAHSQYGRNGNKVTINNNRRYITGMAGDTVTASESYSTTNAYNTTAGMKASTTGNIYGVYDMSGGSDEYTACWDAKASILSDININGKAIDGTVYFSIEGTSDRTKTAYYNGGSGAGDRSQTVCKTGDAIKETWIVGNYSWFDEMSNFAMSNYPFQTRGGSHLAETDAGLFCGNISKGNTTSMWYNTSSRVILAGL